MSKGEKIELSETQKRIDGLRAELRELLRARAQVAALWDRQNDPTKHPYTCGESGCDQVLIPLEDGWHCPEHGLVQQWAHAEDCHATRT